MKNGFIFTLLFVLIILPPLPTHALIAKDMAMDSQMESTTQLNLSPNPFVKNFAVESTKKDLMLEVFSPGGVKIPTTIYRYHSNGIIKYETGAELRSGIYLVRLKTSEDSRFFKMIKMN